MKRHPPDSMATVIFRLISSTLGTTLPGRIALLPVVAWAMLSGDQATAQTQTEEKPNVIVILADDLGYEDLGVQGCRDFATPNLDALARAGVRCISGYVSSPVRSPSRAGLLTGRYQQRFGFEYNPFRGPNNGAPHKTLYWRYGHHRAIRHGKWKLATPANQPAGLYDLSADIAESEDLAEKFPRVVEELTQLYKDWESEMEPPRWRALFMKDAAGPGPKTKRMPQNDGR